MKTLKDQILEVLRTENPHEAFDLAKKIRGLLDQRDDQSSAEYRSLEKIWSQLRMIALRYVPEKGVKDLFSKHISDILELPETSSLRELIDSRLMSETLNEDRARIKEGIRKSILTSQQRIGENTITLGSNQVQPTVENWMKSFMTVLESSQKVSNVAVARFFSSNKDYNALSEQQKSKLRRLIELYKYLLISPDEVQGYVEYTLMDAGDDGLLLIGGGDVQQLEDEEVLNEYEELARNNQLSASELADLQLKYPDRFEKYAINADDKMAPESDPQKLKERLDTFLADQKAKYGNGSLAQLPVNQEIILPLIEELELGSSASSLQIFLEKLRPFFSDEKALIRFLNNKDARELMRNYTPEHFNDPDVLSIERTPYSPMAMQALLEILLKQGYGLDEEEAKWQVYQLLRGMPSNLRTYKSIVSYDVEQDALVWRY